VLVVVGAIVAVGVPDVEPVADNMPVSRGRQRATTGSRWLGLGVGMTLIGAALATELRKPADERTWQGRIAGRVPYDLRPPTLARVHERLWNPEDRHVLVPTVFGVGWSVNLGHLLRPRVARA
jgi:Family of unknown function (DUF5808)